jgi:hypothetical protein
MMMMQKMHSPADMSTALPHINATGNAAREA